MIEFDIVEFEFTAKAFYNWIRHIWIWIHRKVDLKKHIMVEFNIFDWELPAKQI